MAKKATTKKKNHSKQIVDECINKLCDFPVAKQVVEEEEDYIDTEEDEDEVEYEITVVKEKSSPVQDTSPVVSSPIPESSPVPEESSPEPVKLKRKTTEKKMVKPKKPRVSKAKQKTTEPDYKTLFETLTKQQDEINLLKEKNNIESKSSRFGNHFKRIKSLSGKDTKLIF